MACMLEYTLNDGSLSGVTTSDESPSSAIRLAGSLRINGLCSGTVNTSAAHATTKPKQIATNIFC
jgi:hypothetical protein